MVGIGGLVLVFGGRREPLWTETQVCWLKFPYFPGWLAVETRRPPAGRLEEIS